ncbi:MAG: hypothetical protein FWE08_00970 [Oscillospiraceae bacterium]|nr:hypothetical protein [Oscillospiraceae bacterium]
MPKYRKMLPDWEAPYIQSLVSAIAGQSKATLANWCVDYAEAYLLPIYEAAHPDDARPRNALTAARDWLAGLIKLPEAKAYILDCHTAARECENQPAAYGAARGIGQAASTIHAATYCAGLALYGALAVAYDTLGADAAWADLERAAGEECGHMETALRAVSVADEPKPAKLNWNC